MQSRHRKLPTSIIGTEIASIYDLQKFCPELCHRQPRLTKNTQTVLQSKIATAKESIS